MLTRDQRRAKDAYTAVEGIRPDEKLRKDYESRVKGLGAHVIRSGLAATMAFLERDRENAEVGLLLNHLAAAAIPGLEGCTGRDVPARVRALHVMEYMLATRELLRVVSWLRRAVQAQGW